MLAGRSVWVNSKPVPRRASTDRRLLRLALRRNRNRSFDRRIARLHPRLHHAPVGLGPGVVGQAAVGVVDQLHRQAEGVGHHARHLVARRVLGQDDVERPPDGPVGSGQVDGRRHHVVDVAQALLDGRGVHRDPVEAGEALDGHVEDGAGQELDVARPVDGHRPHHHRRHAPGGGLLHHPLGPVLGLAVAPAGVALDVLRHRRGQLAPPRRTPTSSSCGRSARWATAWPPAGGAGCRRR